MHCRVLFPAARFLLYSEIEDNFSTQLATGFFGASSVVLNLIVSFCFIYLFTYFGFFLFSGVLMMMILVFITKSYCYFDVTANNCYDHQEIIALDSQDSYRISHLSVFLPLCLRKHIILS